MWLVLVIALLIMLGQMFLLKEKDERTSPICKFLVIIFSMMLFLLTSLIVSCNTYFITETIKNYKKGVIVKVETTTICGTDTVKVIKYKYK